MDGAVVILSLFIREPQFQGQTKERLASPEAARLVEGALKDHFDHWLSDDPQSARAPARCGHRARRGAPAPPAGARARAQDRDAQAAPARQARRLQPLDAAAAPRSSSSRATAPAARRSRRATARPRRSCRLRGKILNVASASTDRLRAEPGARRSDPGAGLRLGRPLRGRQAALRARHHHDRRRCRRRAYRLAADDLLLPRDAEAGRERPSLPRRAAALSPQPGRQHASMRATTRTRTS